MAKFQPSIKERLADLISEMEGCASCGDGGGMTAGDGGFTGDADAAGPTAGYDPLMGKLDKVRKKRRNKANGS